MSDAAASPAGEPASRSPAAPRARAVAALRPSPAHSTSWPRSRSRAPSAAPISPGCSTPMVVIAVSAMRRRRPMHDGARIPRDRSVPFAAMEVASEAAAGARPSARERILDTAYELFSRHGTRAVGVDRIIAECGIAKMTLYRNFPSKDDLILAFLERRDELWTRAWLQAEAQRRGSTPAERLLAIFDTFAGWFPQEGFEGCSFINVMLELDDVSTARCAQATVRHLADIRTFVRGLAEEAGIQDPDGFARQWHILMKGSIVVRGRGRPRGRGARQAARRAAPRAPRHHGLTRRQSPQTSAAVSTTSRSLSHCCSSVIALPSTVEEKPHCGDRQSWSTSTYRDASSMRRMSSSLVSSAPRFVVTSPSTTTLSFGTNRSGSNPPERVVVPLHEEAVDGELAEQRLGDEVVAALGDPRGAEVAAAHVRRDRHAPPAGPRAPR